MKRALVYLAGLYLVLLLVVWGLIHFDTGSLWPVTLFLFSPRWVVALPLIVLVPLTLLAHFRLAGAYLLHAAVVLFPILGYQVSWSKPETPPSETSLRLMTCNLGGGKPWVEEIVSLVRTGDMEVLMLQESPPSVSEEIFAQLGWTYRQAGNMAIGSAFQLGAANVLARQPESHYRAVAAMACELNLPLDRLRLDAANSNATAGVVQLVSVHLPTFRPALEKARYFDFETGSAIETMAGQYRDVTDQLKRAVDQFTAPMIIAGDFNVPVESGFYRAYWSDFRNVLSSAGTGFGYTKYTRFHGIRIDHVLVDRSWTIGRCQVSRSVGGDHRPVVVELGR